MHRQTAYPYEVPSETDFLYAQRFMYEGLGLALMDVLGVANLAAGLACTATGPASLNVNIGPGRVYSLQNLEPTDWGTLAGVGGLVADVLADHKILKQGTFRDTTAFPCPAPVSVGQSINYLIEAAFSEVDAVPLSLPFVSATPPYPPIAPATLNKVRRDSCVITVKAGTSATTGSQTTPAVDAGNVGLWVVTVAYGQTTITSGNISAYSASSFITETLTQKISQATGDARYAPLNILQALTGAIFSNGSSGYFRVPGTPFILQWTNYSIGVSNTGNMPSPVKWGNASISLPFTFPNAALKSWCGPNVDIDGQLAAGVSGTTGPSSVQVYASSTTTGGVATGTLFVLGY